MRHFFINFRKSVSDQKAAMQTRAHNHLLKIQPFVGKIYKPIKELHNKYVQPGKKYGQS